jgi:hypothetical protein
MEATMRSVERTATCRILILFLAAMVVTSLVASPVVAKVYRTNGSDGIEGDPDDGLDYIGGGGGGGIFGAPEAGDQSSTLRSLESQRDPRFHNTGISYRFFRYDRFVAGFTFGAGILVFIIFEYESEGNR